MPSVPPETVVEQLRWRYATKKFDPTRTIPKDAWSALEQALVLTPSSYGLQPWRFFVVTDAAVKAQLPALSWGQRQPQDCSHMVVFALKAELGEADIDRYLSRIGEVRGQTVESLAGFKRVMMGSLNDPPFDVNEWAARQVYIALGQFMACAAIMGVDTCPMEGIDPAKYDEVLGIAAQGYRTVVGCAAGYRAADDRYAQTPKVRFKTDDVIQRI
ncbi:MAG TPA: NAD(P)H-dependent oxidoreductase [Gemmataceae bacterium]|nr:NAD(P)H-dependent oxidoreductase [Gemmataceae bacterium]